MLSGARMDIVEQIERARGRLGWSISELARRAGYGSPSLVNRVLNRRQEPSRETVQRLASALGAALVIPARPAERVEPEP